jgi:hypothetical protein
MHLNHTDYLFWAAGLLAHVVLLVVIATRHRAETFPFFTTLIAANIVKTITLYLVALYGTTYSYRVTYSCLTAVDLVLQLCVVYEVALHVFRPTGRWAPDVRRGFVIVVAASITVAAGLTTLAETPAKTWLAAVLMRGNFFSSALMSELFAGMIILAVTAGLPWKPHAARIAQGLGFYSLVTILTEAGHNVFGMERSSWISGDLTLLRIVTYLVCVTYWIVMLWRDAPAPRELPSEIRSHLVAFQRLLEYDLRKLRALK